MIGNKKNKNLKNKKEVNKKEYKLNNNNLTNKILINQINKLNYTLEKGKVLDLADLIGNKKRFFIRNLTSGILKGIGAGIGFSVITAIIIYLLQKIIKLNIPIISQYIADIIEIVKNSK